MIPLMKNAFLNEYETKQALAAFVLRTSKFSMDVECREFEREFGKFQGRKHAILFNSGGSANLALLQALKNLGRLNPGDKVGFSALTWSTNVMPVLQTGFDPVPVDCTLRTMNVGSEQLRSALKRERFKALFITNVLGFVGDLSAVAELCREEGVILLEDNCESLGTTTQSGMAGNFGLASTFSFFVAHHMSTIEGGMICTDDDELAEMIIIVRANGWDRNLSAEQQAKWRAKCGIRSEFQAKYTFYDLAFNFRPTEITGFLGRFQLQFLEKNIIAREQNYKNIEATIASNPDLIVLEHDHIVRLSTFAIPIICKEEGRREHYIHQFSGAGIEIRPMIAGNMQSQPFFEKYVKRRVSLPNTDFIHRNGFYCGNYPELSDRDVETIKSAVMRTI
jgi:CDP-6-deoxy-D-xylo-4-hexulose-3-dehydrase